MNFDDIKQTSEVGTYWIASDLMPLFGYKKPARFGDLIDRAVAACETFGKSVPHHFNGISADIVDYTTQILRNIRISRYGCYLLSQEADARKSEIIEAQNYYAPTQPNREKVEQKQSVQMGKSAPFIEFLKNRVAPSDNPVVASFGGGRNSTAMLILCAKLGIKVDKIIFSDTGGELPETYAFIKKFDKWLVNNDMPSITIVRRNVSKVSLDRKSLIGAKLNLQAGLTWILKKATSCNLPWFLWSVGISASQYSTLEEYCLITQGMPSVAYGFKNCSVQWKIEPINAFVKAWKPAQEAWQTGKKVVKLVGIHAGEVSRVLTKSGHIDAQKLETEEYFFSYPLIEKGLTDIMCESIIQNAGLPLPPKSSCFFCPNRKLAEIQQLPENLKMRAVMIEQNALNGVHKRDNAKIKGLGRSFAWNDLDDEDGLALALADKQSAKSCSCID